MLMLMSRQQVGQYQWLVVRQSPPQANNICTKTRYFKLNRGNSQKTIQASSFQPYSASPCVMQLTSSALFFLDAHVRSPCSHPLVNSSPDSISTEVCFNNITSFYASLGNLNSCGYIVVVLLWCVRVKTRITTSSSSKWRTLEPSHEHVV